MITAPAPEMLWESADAVAELPRRFGFTAPGRAVAWAVELLADRYGCTVRSVDRLVISAQNLILWVGTIERGPLLIKVCRLAAAHDWLAARADLVDWLAERDLPVARPVPAATGERQLLRAGHSIGVQPVLPGNLLDAEDPAQVRAAGAALARLHLALAAWPEPERLDHAGRAPSRFTPWAVPDSAPADLRELLAARTAELPELSELPVQPVHTDFRGANLLCRSGVITGILDFEEVQLHPAVFDLAHAVCLLGTWYRDWRPIGPTAQQTLIDSYTELRPLGGPERAWLDPLIGWGMLGLGWTDEARRRLGR